MDNTSAYGYELPEELIAQEPASRREGSRLLVVHRATGQLEHRQFTDLPDYLRKGDVLVLNDTRVIPARLFAEKKETGGRVELLFIGVFGRICG